MITEASCITEDTGNHPTGVGIVIHNQHGNSIQVGRVIAERLALGDPRVLSLPRTVVADRIRDRSQWQQQDERASPPLARACDAY